MKKFLFLFFVILVLFNVLNIIDKITTYYAINLGFVELNPRTIELFNSIGLLPTLLFQVYVFLVFSLLLFLIVTNFSNRIKHLDKFATIPILFLIIPYLDAVIDNIRWLI